MEVELLSEDDWCELVRVLDEAEQQRGQPSAARPLQAAVPTEEPLPAADPAEHATAPGSARA